MVFKGELALNIDNCLSSLDKQETNTWSDKEKIQYRDELGDTVDLFVLKNIQNNILLYDPSMVSRIYESLFPKIQKEVSKWVSDIGLSSFFNKEFSKLEEPEKEEIITSLFNEHFNKITTNLGLGIIEVSEIDFDKNRIFIEVSESAEAHEATKIGHPICFNFAALLSGFIGGVFPNWQAYESSCKTTGSNKCKFILAPQEKINKEIREFLDLPSRISFTLGGKISSMISEFETEIDYTPILEESTNRLTQLFPDMKSKSRNNLGHEVSLKGLQQFYLSFLSDDFEYGSRILYKSGETGGKRFSKILSALGMRQEDKLDVLPRFFDRLGIGLLNHRKREDVYEIRVKECCYSYGLNLDENICFFSSGFFAGFYSQTLGEEFIGKERKCSGGSGKYCVHEIIPSDEEK